MLCCRQRIGISIERVHVHVCCAVGKGIEILIGRFVH